MTSSTQPYANREFTAFPPELGGELPGQLVVREENELLTPAFREEWNHLASESETKTITQTFEWNSRWWQELGGQRKLLILTVWNDARRVAIVPLMQSRVRLLGIPFRVLEFLSMRQADYADIIARPELKPKAAAAVIRYLIEHPELWDTLHLKHLPEYSSTLECFQAAAKRNRLSLLKGVSASCPSHIFNYDTPELQTFMKRKDIERHLKALKKIGPVEFVTFDDPASALRQLPEFFAQHIERRAGLDQRSSYENSANRRFIHSLTADIAGKGWLAFCGLKVNGAFAAFHYGFRYNNFLMYYKPTFGLSLARHSPGLVLLKYLFEWCVQQKLTELDFTIGDESYKSRFATVTRSNGEILISRSLPNAAALRVTRIARAMRESIKLRLKKLPFIGQALRGVKSKLRG